MSAETGSHLPIIARIRPDDTRTMDFLRDPVIRGNFASSQIPDDPESRRIMREISSFVPGFPALPFAAVIGVPNGDGSFQLSIVATPSMKFNTTRNDIIAPFNLDRNTNGDILREILCGQALQDVLTQIGDSGKTGKIRPLYIGSSIFLPWAVKQQILGAMSKMPDITINNLRRVLEGKIKETIEKNRWEEDLY